MFFRVRCCNAALNKNSFGTDTACKHTRHYGLPLLLAKKCLSFQLELNFLFSYYISLLTLIFVKSLYLTKYYFNSSTMHI